MAQGRAARWGAETLWVFRFESTPYILTPLPRACGPREEDVKMEDDQGWRGGPMRCA